MPDTSSPTQGSSAAAERLASALRHLKKAMQSSPGVVPAQDLDARDRSLLVDAGFLRPVMKGWYVCSDPSENPGDQHGKPRRSGRGQTVDQVGSVLECSALVLQLEPRLCC